MAIENALSLCTQMVMATVWCMPFPDVRLVGRELFWHALQTNLHNHLTTNLDKYKEMFKEFYADEDWPDFIKEAAPEFQPTYGREAHCYLGVKAEGCVCD